MLPFPLHTMLFTDIRVILPVSRVLSLDGFSKTILWSEVPNSAIVTGMEYTIFIFVHMLSSIAGPLAKFIVRLAKFIVCLYEGVIHLVKVSCYYDSAF